MKELKWEELATDQKWRSYLQATLKIGEKRNHCLRKQTQAQEKLKIANLVVANTVTNQIINNIVTHSLHP